MIMGITFLAAGTSVPDCMASLIVARQGTYNQQEKIFLNVHNYIVINIHEISLSDILFVYAFWIFRYGRHGCVKHNR